MPVLLGGIPLATAWSNLGSTPTGERLKRISQSVNYSADQGKFVNALKIQDPNLWPVLRDWVKGGTNTRPESEIPLYSETEVVLSQNPESVMRVTWLGHSTQLIEIDGARFLTDPVWGPRAAPWSSLGPSRFHEPPLALDRLPPIDAVVISHDHYDHLDAPTIRQLAKQVPRFLVPLGVGSHLESWGVESERITELDWWEERTIGGVRVIATPARHFSGRAVLDRDKTLWASWSFVGSEHRAFFSGDTGMFPGFAEIGARLGPFDITMVENGACNKMWADVHLGPEQALQAHLDLRGKLMLPVHWGTFDLALHSWTEPVERLLAAAEATGTTVVIPRPGQSVEPAKPLALDRWWPDLPWESADEHPVVSSGLSH